MERESEQHVFDPEIPACPLELYRAQATAETIDGFAAITGLGLMSLARRGTAAATGTGCTATDVTATAEAGGIGARPGGSFAGAEAGGSRTHVRATSAGGSRAIVHPAGSAIAAVVAAYVAANNGTSRASVGGTAARDFTVDLGGSTLIEVACAPEVGCPAGPAST